MFAVDLRFNVFILLVYTDIVKRSTMCRIGFGLHRGAVPPVNYGN